MRLNYKRLGDYIEPCDEKNTGNIIKELRGISNQKYFQKAKTNTIGVDLSKYRIVRTGQFAFNRATTRNGDKISIALRQGEDCIVSPSYRIFKSKNEDVLNSEYLMMWFRRPEFDRYARFKSHGSAHEFFDLGEMYDVELPVPSIEKQRKIVKEYNTIVNRIKLNEELNQKLEETAQALYKHWFVDFEFPNEEGKPYKSSGGEMVYNEELDSEVPKGWLSKKIGDLSELKYGKMLSAEKFLKSGYPVFSGYGIRGYYSEYMYENPEILVLCRGVSGTGEVRMSPAKSYITNLSIVVEISDLGLNKQFLFHYLKNQNLRSLDSGSAQSQITIGDLNNFRVLYPSKETQEQFRNYVLQFENKLRINNVQISTLTILKKILLSRLSVMHSIDRSIII